MYSWLDNCRRSALFLYVPFSSRVCYQKVVASYDTTTVLLRYSKNITRCVLVAINYHINYLYYIFGRPGG